MTLAGGLGGDRRADHGPAARPDGGVRAVPTGRLLRRGRRAGSGAADHSPTGLLALVVVTAGGLSAILANDIVCLAMAPVLVELCARRGLDPLPFLLALACGRQRRVGGHADWQPAEHADRRGARPVVRPVPVGWRRAGRCSGLGVVWGIVARAYRAAVARGRLALPAVEPPPFNRWQTLKGDRSGHAW